jgi:hypothetical protein
MGDSDMNGPARPRELGDALALVLQHQAGAERYRRRQRQLRRGRTERMDRPRPLEFDENGFPVAQRTPSFITRVARLLNAS